MWKNNGQQGSVSLETLGALVMLVVVILTWLWWGTTGAANLQRRLQGDFEAGSTAASVGSVASRDRNARATEASSKAASRPTEPGPDLSASNLPKDQAGTKLADDGQVPNVEVSDYFARLGQTGDLFGSINALFAAIAMVAVFWAGALQRRTMIEARLSNERQHFETVFFELLKLTREIIDRIEHTHTTTDLRGQKEKRTRTGYGALNFLANRYFGEVAARKAPASAHDRAQWLVDQYKKEVFAKLPSALGPYYRMLFQTFDSVRNAPLAPRDQLRFANIARAQMSEGAVFLLALNGMTWRGKRFIKNIEEFGLLEHMHPMYRSLFDECLLLAYKPRAFMGSAQRARAELEGDKPATLAPGALDGGAGQPDFAMSQDFDSDVPGR